ncbi:MAG: DUF4007 family protein [Desulforhopalus sp.]
MSKAKTKFSGHQTFSFRYGWLEKGFRFTKEGKKFSDPNSIVDLGVGKNMVESIKYWSEMAGIVSNGEVTDFGRKLLDENTGWDPFLEDNASLWLLHWKLITNPDFITAGTALFSFLHKPEFSKHDIAEATLRLLDQNKKAPSDNIILRDIDCYIRSYCGTRRFEKKNSEESFGCPLQELNLIQPMSDTDMYRFGIGSKSSLPPEVIGYAICEYLGKENKDAMTIQRVLYREHSPGQVFMLDENALIEAVQELHENPKWGHCFDFTESAGIAQIHCHLGQEDADNLLAGYFGRGDA